MVALQWRWNSHAAYERAAALQQEVGSMTFEANAAAFANAVEVEFDMFAAEFRPTLPAHADVADPEAGWAAANPAKALAFLFVSPRDCCALDELMAL
jgi:hypothetical protein